jgi:hypothetical protein
MADEKKGLKYFEDLGATIAETAPPPSGKVRQGATPQAGGAGPAWVRPVAEHGKKVGKGIAGTVANIVAVPLSATGEFAAGYAAEMYGSIPAQIGRLTGLYDPSKVSTGLELNGRPGEKPTIQSVSSPIPVGGAPAPLLNVPGFTYKPKTVEEGGISIADIKAPETLAGQAGGIAGTVRQFSKAYGPLTEMAKSVPWVASLAAKHPKIATAFGIGSGATAGAMQEVSKTEDPVGFFNSLLWGAGTDLTLKGLGWAARTYGPKIAKRLAQITIPMRDTLNPAFGDDVRYQRETTDRMVKTGSDFTEKGAQAINDRFYQSVDALKNASRDADITASELVKLGKILPSSARMVDYKKKTDETIAKFIKDKSVGESHKNRIIKAKMDLYKELPKELKLDANGNPIPKIDPKTGNQIIDEHTLEPLFEDTGKIREKMTFEEAEKWKVKLNGVLRDLYESGDLSPSDKTDKQVFLKFKNALADAMDEGFNDIKHLVDHYGPSIPANSPAKNLRAWELTVPGEAGKKTYREATHITRIDADLSEAAEAWRKILEPQAKGKTVFNEAAASIGVGQAIHGSFLTPSQLATGVTFLRHPARLTRISKGIQSMSTAQPPTGTAATAGRAVGVLTRPSTTPPSMAEWVQQQAAPASQDNQWTIEQ